MLLPSSFSGVFSRSFESGKPSLLGYEDEFWPQHVSECHEEWAVPRYNAGMLCPDMSIRNCILLFSFGG